MNICIFCGSAPGNKPIYANAATEVASLLRSTNSTLIYGGGKVGLMGIIADQLLQLGGEVIGVIPDFLLKREVGHSGLTRLEVVNSMHERKRRMADLSDVFIAIPGGWGTLDELAEILTWKQLGLINANIGILNTSNYFSPLVDQMKMMVEEGFLKEESLNQIKISSNPVDLFTQLGLLP